MTSPITAEAAAEGICAVLARAEAAFDKRGWIEMPKADRARYLKRALIAKPLIASAIREAEDAALERAASFADWHAQMCEASPTEDERENDMLGAAWGCAEDIAKRIRSLKSTKETGHE